MTVSPKKNYDISMNSNHLPLPFFPFYCRGGENVSREVNFFSLFSLYIYL